MCKYSEDNYLQLSGIQHFSFCRRQWSLIHIENIWSDNALTVQGNIVHERVHDNKISELRNGVLTTRGMYIKSHALGISGACDAVEFTRNEDGISLFGRKGKWTVTQIEYKHGRSKINDCDRLQLCAQAICLEEMFSFPISEAYLFYNETKRREKVILDDQLRQKVKNMFEEMHTYFERGYTPKAKFKKSCQNCSLYNYCLPEIFSESQRVNVKKYIKSYIDEGKEI